MMSWRVLADRCLSLASSQLTYFPALLLAGVSRCREDELIEDEFVEKLAAVGTD